MSQVVWKYEVLPDEKPLLMPMNARLLHVHAQGDSICLWAVVDPEAPLESRNFLALPTGREFTPRAGWTYCGTVHMHGGALVFHLFEVSP